MGRETRLAVDAGPHGLGLILLQKQPAGWKAVFNASRSLTNIEERYSQLDREALAIRWACERCYTYLIGSSFTVITDHEPLLPYFKNPNKRPTLRIERWLMYLQQFDLKVEYRPGKENIADYLSRHAMPLSEKDGRKSEKYEDTIRMVLQTHVPRALTLEEIRTATKEDEDFQRLIQYIHKGKEQHLKSDPQLKPFSKIFHELSVVDDVVMRVTQIVIPPKLQDRVIEICHEGHLGIVKSKQFLRSKVWFPNIDKKMEAKCKRCLPCQATVSQKPRSPLQMTETPSKPWENVAADFCGPYPSGELILVVIDERTRYPEVEIVNNTSAESTIIAMEKMFATHGYPEKLKSDNGPPFKSHALREFFTEKGITHHRVTPRWPEANGLAENFMKSVGKVIKTANMENKNWRRELFRFLANYRQTPHPNTGKSPRSLMFQREIRGKLPNMIQEEEKDDIKERDTAIKAKQKEKLDEKRRTKEHTIKKGDLVLVKHEKTNKLSTPYGPTPHIVERVKGSMITATRGNARTTRNSSFFKKIEGNAEDIKLEEENDPDIDEPESEEIEEEKEEIINENVEVDQEYRSRSGRIIRKPKYLDDFET